MSSVELVFSINAACGRESKSQPHSQLFPRAFPFESGTAWKSPSYLQAGTDALEASVQEKTEKSQQLWQVPLGQTDSSKERLDL